MQPKDILGAVAQYRVDFETRGIRKANYPLDELYGSITRGLEHCHAMLEEIEQFIADGHLADAERWFGFVQGNLWIAGWYTIEDLRKHNGTGGIQH